jgi:plastocyanin
MNRKQKLIFTLLLLMLALVACAENEGDDSATATVEPEATAAQLDEPVEAEPTSEPVSEETVSEETASEETVAEAPAPSETVPAATGTPAAEATVAEEPALPRLGLLRFRDSAESRAGSYQLLLEGISPAPNGTHYELWLVDGSFNTINLGEVAVSSSVDYSGSTAENLIARYNGAFISTEPDGVDDGEIGPIAYNGVIPAESLLHIRHVVTAFEANPERKAFLIGAEEQLLLAIEHSGFLQDELDADNLREAQRHAEHVVNILDGESGDSFGDLDGDSVAQNPGDGLGVRAYVQGAQQHAQLAADAEGATAEVQLHAGHVLISGDNMLFWIDAAIKEALRVIASDSAGEAQAAAEELARQLNLTYEGQDVDGDGAVAPIEREGGWQTAYEHALNMGSLEFFPANAAAAPAQEEAVAAPPAEDAQPGHEGHEAGSEPVEEEEPAEEAEPVDEPAAEPEAVTIEMANFAFQPGDITVPVGTAVTWVNKDNGPRHSATAADGSFDTGLLDAGQEATIVFDTPGTYVYYCTLHGSPDGSGMAATITVTE